jgi:uncharacterized protein YndB with AHSA1/START domain
VWNALVNPETIKQYMFGTKVASDWWEGGPIVWKGEWQGKANEDRGVFSDWSPNESSSTAISARSPALPMHAKITIG